MQQILVIAKQTFKEAVRNKILFVFIVLSIITICCSVFMPVVGDGSEKIKAVESMCFRSITFFGTLAAILLSASSIPADIENGVLCTVTTKPVHRINIIIGKITGFIYIIGVLLVITGSVSYALVRLTASQQNVQGNNKLSAREKFHPYSLKINGKEAGESGNILWVEGGGKGTSAWEFNGLYYKDRNDDLEIEAEFLIESKKRNSRKIPVNIKIINPYNGRVLTESIEVLRDRPAILSVSGKFLEGSEELTIIVSPENSGDFIGMDSDKLRILLGDYGFGYNYLKGIMIISFQFLLMVIIAVLGSTLFSLPVNILFCLFVFFCGNITDFIRDLTTVINIYDTHDHDSGISTVMKKSNVLIIFMNYVVKKPVLLLSYILPDFKNFSVGSYFIDDINIPYRKVLMSLGYAALYTFVCLPASFVIFKRREIA